MTYPKESLAEAGTDYPVAFARHFARLIWLLLNDVTAYDAQLATLRALVNASREGAVTLASRDWRLVVNGSVLSDKFSGAQDLTAQLMEHSVVELTAEQNASPADLLCLSRILAGAPVPGDGGRNIQKKLEVFEARRIAVRLETPPAATPAVVPDEAHSVLHLPPRPAPEADGDVEEEERDLYREQDADKMFQSFSAVEAPKVSMQKHFELLDAAHTPTALTRQLDTLVQLANDSARKERVDLVAEIFHGLVLREAGTEDRAVKRSYGLAIRRLCTPGVLRAVISLLPRRRENYEQYLSIIARAEDAGAEALVEALVSAGSISDRRAYFDAMLNCRSGVRVLLFMLGDERWYVVRNACDLLGELRVTDADAQLTRLLDHEDERVRAAAAGALAKIGTGVAAKGLRVALRDASPEVRERAAAALGSTRGARSAASLIKAIDREEDIRVQMAMLTALGQIGTPDAVQKLVTIAKPDARLFKKNKASLRAAAVHALAEAKTPLAIATLQSLLRDKEKDVRGAAAWVLLGKKRESGAQPAVDEA
ncbi:MAG TPA: HEAT repeat domain-containing protein [Gemmatimonadaceae bacterium]|nr:HEAT repeat domain-containing protein [Gemmatimonadaceae bacterium]